MKFPEFLKRIRKECNEAYKDTQNRLDNVNTNPAVADLFPYYVQYQQFLESRRLTKITWSLAIATWVLAVATIVLVFFTR